MVRTPPAPGIVIVSDCVAVTFGLAESVTLTVNSLVVLPVVGVPEITP